MILVLKKLAQNFVNFIPSMADKLEKFPFELILKTLTT